jgi:transcriptional regulator with XRE-family HTH domain
MITHSQRYPAGRYAMGARIKAVRLSLGLTQTELGARVGLSCGTMSMIEAGRHRTTFLAEIAMVLDVSARWLSLGVGRPPLFANRELRQVVSDVTQETPIFRSQSPRMRTAAAEAQRIWAKQGPARNWWRAKVGTAKIQKRRHAA